MILYIKNAAFQYMYQEENFLGRISGIITATVQFITELMFECVCFSCN